ncbi:MAG: hypothetical protein AAF738_07500 [Bacteroidota bacterium]
MIRSKYLGVLLMCLCWNSILSGQTLYEKQTITEGKFSIFTTDKLLNCYVVDSDNKLIKYNLQGEVVFEYTNNTLGAVGQVDATDPFNVLLFYPDYQTLVFLDRTLTETQRIDLFELDIFEVQTVCLSKEHQIWLYDANTFQLKRIDQNGTVRQESDDLRLLFGASFDVIQLQEQGTHLYVNTAETGIFIFDIFGTYLTRLDFDTHIQHTQVINEQLVFLENDRLSVYDLTSKLTRTLWQDTATLKGFHIQKDKMYLQQVEQIDSGLRMYDKEVSTIFVVCDFQ